MTAATRPIGVYYEHPDWFRPLLPNSIGAAVPPRRCHPPLLRDRSHNILYTLNYLAHLEQCACAWSTA